MDEPTIEASLCYCRSLRDASRRLLMLYEAALRPVGLRMIEFALLNAIGRDADASFRTLGARFMLDRSSLRYRLLPLVDAGLIEISADDRDRRGRSVKLTSDGYAKLTAAKPLWEAAQARFETTFGRDDAESLLSAARTIRSASFAEAFASH